ncbi:hypothetical protein T10_1885 [Trichinella papuae]|uniref:Uncharacterized protein n=1 Tax=Trichinella papuae TaxID=268474 RepID=A0A0V1MR74_9BILA|nr:hypothetical protein T10_1885 [Trichinella papuae]
MGTLKPRSMRTINFTQKHCPAFFRVTQIMLFYFSTHNVTMEKVKNIYRFFWKNTLKTYIFRFIINLQNIYRNRMKCFIIS